MLRTTPMLKPGDILINDRGFLSRNLINYLKTVTIIAIISLVKSFIPELHVILAYILKLLKPQ